MQLKIKRHEYEITEKDIFMDNGACIQLLTQSKERGDWGRRPTPKLSKRAIIKINKFEKIPVESKTKPSWCKLFSLKLN